jgi:hypothetical protein
MKDQETKKAWQVKNYRQIKVKFLGPTNHRGARIKIYEPKRYYDNPEQSKIFSYSYKYGDIMEQAYATLVLNGWNVVARASDAENYIFLCDNWSDDFKEIKDLK